MNWQYVKNVEPPKNKIIMLYVKTTGNLTFGRIKDDGILEFSTSFFAGGIGLVPSRYPFEEFLKIWPNVMWAPFIKP